SLSSPFLKNSLSSPSLKNSANASLSLSQSKQTHLPLSPSSPSLIPELQLRRRRHKFNIRHTVSDCLNLSRSEFVFINPNISHNTAWDCQPLVQKLLGRVWLCRMPLC
ncbi:hypothetical protein CFOL_v3_02534, partial [Cephalotus follicularis]